MFLLMICLNNQKQIPVLRQSNGVDMVCAKTDTNVSFFVNIKRWAYIFVLNLLKMSLFGAPHGWEWWGQKTPLLKTCHTPPTAMKLDTVILCLKKTQKYIINITQPLSSTGISISWQEISKFALSRNKDTNWILITVFNYFIFLQVFKSCFNKYGYHFDDVSKNGYSRP